MMVSQAVEGTFSICSFWLVEALTRAGQSGRGQAEPRADVDLCQPPGLVFRGDRSDRAKQRGTFPQAFTHLALIRACYTLDQALGEHRPTRQ